MICSACGTANEPGRKFCKECGAALALSCPSCGASNTPDSKFCGECGSALGVQASAANGPEPATERRMVTVVFADLVGSTSLAEHRDAEDTRELLSSYFDVAREAVERHGGLVEKYIGDAVMAVWGTPVAHEDDAERAVRTALEILDAVEALGVSRGLPLRARGGVLTGEAAATVGAISQGIVVGDMVNTASRLQSAADAGTVLVGEATYRAASPAVAFEEVGELTLRGRQEPVRAWRALRVVGERGGAGRSSGLEPPFVGRAEELRLVKESLHATGREGKARLVSVIGIAGIGKSRLAWEFLKYIDGLAETVWWHQGRCPAYGEGVTFWALGEMVRMRARIAETDSSVESRRKLAATVEQYVEDPDERRWIEPRLAHLLGLEDRPTGEREELFSAWRTFFERIAEGGPTVLVFEDLQWADPGLLDFIESMLEWSRNLPILIVTLARPELVDERPGWGSGHRSFTSLRLEPLTDEAIADLVRRFVQGLPEDGVARIVERAAGVPLYAVETVRMLADRGVLAAHGETFRLVGDLGDLEVPETLHSLIAARLDALPPEERALLQEASVLGKSFTADALVAVAGGEPDATVARLRDLVHKEFLRQDADPRSPERGQYAFLQGLIREVAYGTLSRAERRRLHLATAHQLESVGDDELAGVVAAHYVEAFRTVSPGPDADAIGARARDWLGQAAERARSLGSPEQALSYAEQALAITPDGAERAALLEQAGEAATTAARHEAAIGYFDDAIALYQAAGDVDAVGHATARTTWALDGLDRRPEAVQRLTAALADLGDEGHDRARAELLNRLATTVRRMGDLDRTIEYVERALPLLERLDMLEQLQDAMATKAYWMVTVGRHREARALFDGALGLANELGDQASRARVLVVLGITQVLENPRTSFQCWLEAAELARRAGARGLELSALSNLIEVAIDLGEWTIAREALEDVGSRADLPIESRRSLALNTALLAGYRGDVVAATDILERETAALQDSDFVMGRTWRLRVRSLVALMADDLDAAYRDAMEAVEAEPTGGNAPNSVWAAARAALWLRDVERASTARAAMEALRGRWIANCKRLVDAGIAALEGRSEQAATGSARGLETWEAMDHPLERVATTVDAATLLLADTLPAGAVDWARAYAEELGAVPLLDRLNAVTGTADVEVGR